MRRIVLGLAAIGLIWAQKKAILSIYPQKVAVFSFAALPRWIGPFAQFTEPVPLSFQLYAAPQGLIFPSRIGLTRENPHLRALPGL